MVTGLVLLLASGMGIVCGWQPMPDGDASYECVIQLEPELIGTLKGGGSIPLSVDIPDHVRPIKRVRIVVGTGPVPQQSLVTNLKPWPGDETKQSRDGVVEAQYSYPNNPADNRYPAQPTVAQPVLPPSDYAAKAQEAFARSLQNGGQAISDAANQATQAILPPDPSRAVSDAVDRTGQQLSNQVKNVGDTVDSNIRQMFGGEPVGEILPNQGAQNSQILPPGSAPPAGNSVLTIPANSGQVILPPGDNRSVSSGSDWQSRGSAVPNPTSADPRRMTPDAVPGIDPSRYSNQNFSPPPGTTPTSPAGGAPPAFNARNSSVVPPNESYPYSMPAPERNAVGIADSRTRTSSSSIPADSGPGFPEFTPTVSGDPGLARSTTPTTQPPSNVPEIRRNMLNVPADAALQGANGLPIAQQNPNLAPAAGSQPAPTTPGFDWNTPPQSQPPTQSPLVQTAANSVSMFPMLLSWVLLSGSGAGNLYLFWSYLDIRNKYRDVLYEASRKISGRHGRD